MTSYWILFFLVSLFGRQIFTLLLNTASDQKFNGRFQDVFADRCILGTRSGLRLSKKKFTFFYTPGTIPLLPMVFGSIFITKQLSKFRTS